MAKWTTSDIPDQTGRVAVITGANTGLGPRFNFNQCKVDAMADGSGKVKSVHTDGSCARTIDMLRR